MKGVILAGGSGTRMYPFSKAVNKHLALVYDKPLIYYPLSILMLTEIKDVLLITNPHHLQAFQDLLGDGSQWGIKITYATQQKAAGLAEAFIIGADFIGNDSCCLILGDNIFHGDGLTDRLCALKNNLRGATVLAYRVPNPQDYGVVCFDKNGEATSLEEKPKTFKSNYAIPGLYFYDNRVVSFAREVRPSHRGELEITSINQMYLEDKSLQVCKLGRGVAWLDAGSPDNLLAASQFVETIEKRQGTLICSPDELALRMGFISKTQYSSMIDGYGHSQYRSALVNALSDFESDQDGN